MRALRIPAPQDAPITELEVLELEDYRAAVGGSIVPVDVPDLGITISVHEQGVVLGLPFNPRATFLWWYFVPRARQKAMLVGPALIAGLPDQRGDSTDIPAHVIELLTTPGSWRIEAHATGIEEWYVSQQAYDDYFEALVYAVLLLERWDEIDDARVVRVLPTSGDELAGGADRTEPAV